MIKYKIIVIGLTVFIIVESNHLVSHMDHVPETPHSAISLVVNGGYQVSGSYVKPASSFYHTGSMP